MALSCFPDEKGHVKAFVISGSDSLGGDLFCRTEMTVLWRRNARSVGTPYACARSFWKIRKGSRSSSNASEEGRLSVLIALTDFQMTVDKGTPHEG